MAAVNRPGSGSPDFPQAQRQPQLRMGIDENGLGPRLGPLVVTAVLVRTEGAGHERASRKARGALARRLGDSKKLVSHGDTALGEAWARAIVRRMRSREGSSGGDETPEGIVRALSLDTADVLRGPCPGAHGEQCWNSSGEAFTADAALVDTIERDLGRLEAQGVDVLGAALVVTCVKRLNDGVARGLSRFDLDLHAMERLALAARAREGSDVIATCGKVGGFDRYAEAFGPMNGRLHTVVEEGRARSEYAVPGLGRIAFVRDADESNMLVSMASLVGKWVRDLLMARIVRHHRQTDAGLPDASGYHDPVTTQFIASSRLAREASALPDECFTRRAVGNP